MDTTLRNRLGILALIVFAVAAAVLAALAPRLPDPDESDFLAELLDSSNYALINFLFVGAFILSMWGAHTIPDLLQGTKGAQAATWGWWVYLVGATLLCAFIAADGVFTQMLRVLYATYDAGELMRPDAAAAGQSVPAPVTLELARHYIDVNEIRYFGIVASLVWIAGLGLLAYAIYQAEETPLIIDGPIVAGVALLLLSLVVDVVILAVLGYLALAFAFGALGYQTMPGRRQTSS